MRLNHQYVCAGTLALFISAGTGAAPNPTNVSLHQAETLTQGAELTVTGEGFGDKVSDSPVFVDYGEVTYENGTRNNFNESLSDMTPVPTTDDSPNAPWTGIKGQTDPAVAFIKKTGDMRHPHSGAEYLMKGANAWVGRPKAYGGTGGWDLPKGNSKLYVAWWIKAKYNPDAYYRMTPLNKSGNFVEGESITTSSGITGRYIDTDSEGLLNFEFVDFGNIRDLKNELIRGKQSGATTTFPEQFRAGSGEGFQSPGSQKYIRVWDEESGKEGIRFSWTQMHQTIAGEINWESTPLTPNKWHLFELEMDTSTGTVQTSVNGDKMNLIEFPEATAATDLGSPTIATLGLNGKAGKFQEITIDDIYMDNQFNRVVIANAANFENTTHYEIQNYSKWNNQTITLKANLGSFKNTDGLYLYIADPEGNFNSQGLPLDDLIEAPPKKTELTVQ